MTERRSILTQEWVRVTITEHTGATIAASTVQFAFTRGGAPTWLTGEWESAAYVSGQTRAVVGGVLSSVPQYSRVARILAGPTGTYVPTAGTDLVSYKFTDSPEIPARPSSYITWY